MEQQIIEILNSAKWAGATIVFILYGLPPILALIDKKWVRGNFSSQVEEDLALIKDNHLHTISNTLERIETKLGKLDDIKEGIIYIKARLNGK